MWKQVRILGAAALGIAVLIAARRRAAGPFARIQAQLSTLRARLGASRAGGQQNGLMPAHLSFEWVALDRESNALKDALASQDVRFVLVNVAAGATRRGVVTSRLTAVGMHFDQGSLMTATPYSEVRASGSASAAALTAVIDRFLQVSREGLIVDTTSNVVEIDEHPDLGPDGLVLIEPNGAHQLRAGSRGMLADALQHAADRTLPLGFRPRPDLGTLRRELADLPRTFEVFLLELANAPTSSTLLSYERVERLGALRRCDQCATPIVDVSEVSELIAEFYGEPSRRHEVADALVRSGLETGDLQSPNYCSRHGQITPTSNQ